jgi:conjugal transfer/entry exclusion protein
MMDIPETINIAKYAEALNNLVGMDIGYLGESDENVNTIVEVIRTAKALENRVKELEAEKDALIKNYAQCMKDYARDIFDDISKDSENWGCYCISAFKWGYVTSDVSKTLAKFRKKYAEGNNE